MRSLLLSLALFFTVTSSAFAQLASFDEVLEGNINADRTLTANKKYLLRGFVNVNPPATLTIEPGTLIYGEESSKGSLIINRGAKIIANGTKDRPIVMTSQKPRGQRGAGDWGGLIIAGNAAINIPGGVATLEGGTNTQYGGGANPNDNDNSGILRYFRLEFSGIPFQPDNEINGITLGGVGRGTTIEYVQVSYNGDDSWEWFGGSVNAKYIISLAPVDDDFDTDTGFSGNIQYAFSLRSPNLADVSGSNAFESDNATNDAVGATALPRTRATFSNVTLVGPSATPQTQINALFRNAQQIRRGSHVSTYNSAIVGWPGNASNRNGILIDGDPTNTAASSGDMEVRNTIIAGATNAVTSNRSAIIANGNNWFLAEGKGNQILTNNSDLMLVDPFNLTNPDPRPMPNSPAATGAAFTVARINNDFFDKVTYRGAFSPTQPRWDAGWAAYDPQNVDYSQGVPTSLDNESDLPTDFVLEQNYPNPFNPTTTISFSLPSAQQVSLNVYDITGRQVATLMNNERRPAGQNSAVFNAAGLSSGVYFYILQAGSARLTQKMTLIK
jgi:hypothetical protein